MADGSNVTEGKCSLALHVVWFHWGWGKCAESYDYVPTDICQIVRLGFAVLATEIAKDGRDILSVAVLRPASEEELRESNFGHHNHALQPINDGDLQAMIKSYWCSNP